MSYAAKMESDEMMRALFEIAAEWRRYGGSWIRVPAADRRNFSEMLRHEVQFRHNRITTV